MAASSWAVTYLGPHHAGPALAGAGHPASEGSSAPHTGPEGSLPQFSLKSNENYRIDIDR